VIKGTSGTANSFVLDATEDAANPGLSNLAWNPAAPGTGRLLSSAGDAQFKVDGLAITSPSNTIADAIPGVTLTLNGTNAGAPTQVSFSDPSTSITAAMSDLVGALNEVLSLLNTDTNSQTGDLSRDNAARTLKRAFSSLTTAVIMPNAAAGTPSTLSDLGVSIQRDGSYSLDSTKTHRRTEGKSECRLRRCSPMGSTVFSRRSTRSRRTPPFPVIQGRSQARSRVTPRRSRKSAISRPSLPTAGDAAGAANDALHHRRRPDHEFQIDTEFPQQPDRRLEQEHQLMLAIRSPMRPIGASISTRVSKAPIRSIS
jgi:hypothetical protein